MKLNKYLKVSRIIKRHTQSLKEVTKVDQGERNANEVQQFESWWPVEIPLEISCCLLKVLEVKDSTKETQQACMKFSSETRVKKMSKNIVQMNNSLFKNEDQRRRYLMKERQKTKSFYGLGPYFDDLVVYLPT